MSCDVYPNYIAFLLDHFIELTFILFLIFYTIFYYQYSRPYIDKSSKKSLTLIWEAIKFSLRFTLTFSLTLLAIIAILIIILTLLQQNTGILTLIVLVFFSCLLIYISRNIPEIKSFINYSIRLIGPIGATISFLLIIIGFALLIGGSCEISQNTSIDQNFENVTFTFKITPSSEINILEENNSSLPTSFEVLNVTYPQQDPTSKKSEQQSYGVGLMGVGLAIIMMGFGFFKEAMDFINLEEKKEEDNEE